MTISWESIAMTQSLEIIELRARIAELEAELARSEGSNLILRQTAIRLNEFSARIAELEAELAGVRACLVEHGQRLAAVNALITSRHPAVCLAGPGKCLTCDVRAAATGDTT